MNISFVFMLLSWFMIGDTARILVYIPTPSISHQVVFRPLVQELVKRGHEVVHITTDPVYEPGKTPANLTEISVHDRSYKMFKDAFLNTPRGKQEDFIDQIDVVMQLITDVFYDQLNDTAVQEIVFSKNKFDLLFLEAVVRPALALTHVFKVPTILGSSLGPVPLNLHAIGAPTHPFLYPTMLHQKFQDLTFWDKINELYLYNKVNYVFDKLEPVEHEKSKSIFGSDLPYPSDLLNNIDMLFLNIHPILEGNRPVPPGVVYMWGIHKKPQKNLPQDLKSYLDNSKHGVIYMSFGTNTDPSKLSPNIMSTFMKVFCRLPYDVLFKWDKDVLPGKCENVKIGKWFPQSDLLKHPNIKLFITQGGLQSTDEAITARVPLIGIPMLGDQWYNVAKYVKFNIGVQLGAATVTEESFEKAIKTVIEDESYRRNIEKLDALMKDEPMPALDRAVWWVEYVLRHGGARHLRSPAANISWAQYLELQLVAVVFSIISITIASIMSVLYYIYKQLNFKKSKSKTH